MIELELLIKERVVGVLSKDDTSHKIGFNYDKEWVSNGFPLSPALPLDGSFGEEHIESLIENLLPEGDALSAISIFYQISLSNKFALIAEIGHETVGALTFRVKGARKKKPSLLRLKYPGWMSASEIDRSNPLFFGTQSLE